MMTQLILKLSRDQKKNTQGMRDAGEEGKGEKEAKCEQLVWVQGLWKLYTHYNFSVKFEIIDIHKISKSRVGRKRKWKILERCNGCIEQRKENNWNDWVTPRFLRKKRGKWWCYKWKSVHHGRWGGWGCNKEIVRGSVECASGTPGLNHAVSSSGSHPMLLPNSRSWEEERTPNSHAHLIPFPVAWLGHSRTQTWETSVVLDL